MLEGYAPSAGEERAHVEMLVLAEEPGDVLSRYHYTPGHFTASGFVTSVNRDLLLLVFHERLGRWLQPGGHIEPEDVDLWVAVRREITEETGLRRLAAIGDGAFDLDVHDIPAAQGEPAHRHYDVRFLFAAEGDAFAGDGIRDVAWVPIDEVSDFATDRSLLRAASKLVAGTPGS